MLALLAILLVARVLQAKEYYSRFEQTVLSQ
jgi:hypothetical protein